MNSVVLFPLVLLLLLLGFGMIAVPGHFVLTRRRVKMRDAWQRLNAALRERHDIVGRLLVSCGVSRRETASIRAARNAARTASLGHRGVTECVRAERQLSAELRAFVGILAADPDAVPGGDAVSEVLAVHQRIAAATDEYNFAVYKYGQWRFPVSVLAAMFGFAAWRPIARVV